jgi:hypothetical protein
MEVAQKIKMAVLNKSFTRKTLSRCWAKGKTFVCWRGRHGLLRAKAATAVKVIFALWE